MKRIISLFFCLLCMSMLLSCGMAEQVRGIIATIDGGNADRVHLRAGPSIQSASLGLYFTGTEVLCESDPSQEWTKVVIGSQDGYMKSEYLRWGNGKGSVQPKQPLGIVQTNSWVNIRNKPSMEAQINGKLYNGELVTIFGETASHWYYATSVDDTGYIKADYVLLSESSGKTGMSSSAQLTNPQNVTETLDSKNSLEASIMAINCSVNLIPTDNNVVTCQYDANSLKLTESVERGTHILTFESRSQTNTTAAATLYIPRNIYYQIYLDVKNGSGSVAGGFQCYRIIHGDRARLSLSLASDDRYGYTLGLIDSECIVGISEVAENYSISIEGISNCTISTAYDMPTYQPGAASYAYSKGRGEVQIKGSYPRNSNLEFIYVR